MFMENSSDVAADFEESLQKMRKNPTLLGETPSKSEDFSSN